jgi:hypothetical protein
MTEKEIEELDYRTREMLERAQANIREELARMAANGEIENSRRR